MNIKRIKLADVKPAAYNPRRQLKPGEKEYEALKASISRWSLVEPLVVNLRTGNLVGGHQRYNVLLDLGHTEAEAAVVDLDEKQEKAAQRRTEPHRRSVGLRKTARPVRGIQRRGHLRNRLLRRGAQDPFRR